MPSLPLGQLITAALVVFVVIAVLWGGKGIAHAGDKISDLVGFPLGPPSIRSFTATPDGKGNMEFKLSLAHSTSDTELLIYQLYTPTPDKDLNNMAPDYTEKNVVFDLLPDTTTEAGQKLGEELENGVIKRACPKDVDKTPGKHGCTSSLTYQPGGYKFVAVLMKRGESTSVDSKDVITGFYDENYVEMLNTPVFGCEDSNFQNCNVIECKKKLINVDLNDPFLVARDVRKPIVAEISNEFKTKRPGCGDYQDVVETFKLNVDGCTKEEVDELNIQMVRARLLESAFEYSTQSIRSEDEYVTNLGKLKLDFWKEQAVRMTMSCTTSLGGLKTPKGAHGLLQSLGWQFVPIGETPKIWKGRVNTELNRILDSLLKPVIIDAVAGTNKDNQLELAWKLPVGKDSLTQYQLKLFHSSAALDEGLTDAKEQEADKKIKLTDVAVQQPGKSDLLFKYPDAGSLASAQMGSYWFELATFVGQNEISKVDVHTGMYDNNYIELYRDLIGVDDACDSNCDVLGKKEAALGSDKLGLCRPSDENCDGKYTGFQLAYLELAFNKHEAEFQFACHPPKLQRGNFLDAEWLTPGCLPREIDILYREVVTAYAAALPKDVLPLGKTVADLLSVDCNKEGQIGWMGKRYEENGIKAVCDAKNRLKEKLVEFKRGYTGS